MVNPSTVRQLSISALIFTAIIAGCFVMIASFIPTDAGDFSTYNNSMNKFRTIKNNTDAISDATEGAEPSEGVEGILSGLYAASFGIVKQVWTSVGTMKDIIYDMGNGATPFKLPEWFTGLMVGIIGITVVFAIVASWQKWYI